MPLCSLPSNFEFNTRLAVASPSYIMCPTTRIVAAVEGAMRVVSVDISIYTIVGVRVVGKGQTRWVDGGA